VDSAGKPAQVADFNAKTPYTWTIVSAGGIGGFSVDKFTVNTNGFLNANSGTFAVQQAGNDLQLTYSPQPVAKGAVVAIR
jgi:hypothetical protein